jgi:hypothetical protein
LVAKAASQLIDPSGGPQGQGKHSSLLGSPRHSFLKPKRIARFRGTWDCQEEQNEENDAPRLEESERRADRHPRREARTQKEYFLQQ